MITFRPSVGDDPNRKSPAVLRRLIENRTLLLTALTSSVGGLLFGYDQGVISSILEMQHFKEKFPMSSAEKGLLVSILEIGGFVGCYILGAITDKISRKYSTIVALLIFITGSALQTGSQQIGHMIAGRLIGGIGVGALSFVGPLYMCELSPPDIRGAIVGVYLVSLTTGLSISFWIDYATASIDNDWQWRVPLLIQVVIGKIMALATLFLPYSPRWLMYVGRDKDAYRVLQRIRPPTDDIDAEWKEIKTMVLFEHTVERQQVERRAARHASTITTTSTTTSATDQAIALPPSSPKKSATRSKLRGFVEWCRLERVRYANVMRNGMWKRVLIGCIIFFVQQFMGINGVIYYAPFILRSLGITSAEMLATGVIGILTIFGAFAAMFLLDRLGRRTVFLSGAVGIAIPMFVVGILSSLFSQNWTEHASAGWTCVVMIYIYVAMFGYSWGPGPWLCAEIFPQHVRAKAVAITSSSHWLFNFVIGFITPILLEASSSAMYYLFGGFSVFAFFFVYFFLPETTGKSMESATLFVGVSPEDIKLIKEIQAQVDKSNELDEFKRTDDEVASVKSE